MLNPRFIVIALLGFSSGLPFALIGTTLQAWFSDQQAPLAVIGLLSVVNLPYAIRWLWSIGFDKHAVLNIGFR
jgi:MFS transporter, PAT family, beta-lactamase induction signal transducer AmpG